jgi:hypothetical protein
MKISKLLAGGKTTLWKPKFRSFHFPNFTLLTVNIYCTGKAIPLQAWTGPEGSRRMRLPDFKTIVT